ncbi:MAG TPA: glycosyltransferase family 2 protein [Inquilinus sp.]|nr:glycosyltransferase family 2 protein [Inquilinus sp.]
MIPVSVVIPSLNEAANIEPCLEALREFDQVLVVDSLSTDGTAAAAERFGATVVEFRWNGQYPKKKEWGMTHPLVRNDWVLALDADEVLSPALVREIARLFEKGQPKHAGYFIDGRYVFLGKPLRYGHHNSKLMLSDRRRTVYPHPADIGVQGGWEVEGHYQPAIQGSVGRLRAALTHWDRKPLSALLRRYDLYTDWEARLAEQGVMMRLADTDTAYRRLLKTIFRRIPARGLVAFLHSYVLKLGFLDGAAGFHFAMSRGFYYWQSALKRRELAATGTGQGAAAAPAAPASSAGSPVRAG